MRRPQPNKQYNEWKKIWPNDYVILKDSYNLSWATTDIIGYNYTLLLVLDKRYRKVPTGTNKRYRSDVTITGRGYYLDLKVTPVNRDTLERIKTKSAWIRFNRVITIKKFLSTGISYSSYKQQLSKHFRGGINDWWEIWRGEYIPPLPTTKQKNKELNKWISCMTQLSEEKDSLST